MSDNNNAELIDFNFVPKADGEPKLVSATGWAEIPNNKGMDEAHAASLIAVSTEGARSFRMKIASPEGRSYAEDIAVKYGVTYEQLTGGENS